MDDSIDNEGDLSPVELFGLLANETRMAAMQALWDAGSPLSFSELAKRAGVSDTGNFTYHLEKLRPNFIRNVDDRYTLTHAGQRVLTTVLAGRFTEHSVIKQTTVDHECPFCGAEIVLEHGDDVLRASCTECPGIYRGRAGEERITKVWLPPAGVREQSTATLDAAMQWTYTRNWSFARGVCPECAGAVETSAELCPDHDPANGLCDTCNGRYGVIAYHRCRRCHESVSVLPVVSLLTDRRVRTFYSEHGPDPTTFTFEAMAALLPYEEMILDRAPVLFEVCVERNDETLVVTADDRIEARSVDRRER